MSDGCSFTFFRFLYGTLFSHSMHSGILMISHGIHSLQSDG